MVDGGSIEVYYALPPEDLGTGRSEIRNRVLAPIFKDLKLIESWGTGIQKMRREVSAYPDIELTMRELGHAFQVQFKRRVDAIVRNGSVEPVTGEVTGEVTGQVKRLLSIMEGEMKRQDIQAALGLKHEDHFRAAYLLPAIETGLIEMTIPDKPRSSKQRYRLTAKGLTIFNTIFTSR